MAVQDVGMRYSVAPPGFGYRWTICALIFMATTINYVDRQVLGILALALSVIIAIRLKHQILGTLIVTAGALIALGSLGIVR